MEKRIDYMKSEIDGINYELNYMDNRIYYNNEFKLRKPIDSVKLDSFLSTETEENSYFSLFR